MILNKIRIPQVLSRAFFGTNFFIVLATLSTISLSSCDKASILGLDVQPEDDLLNVAYSDTTSIRTRTVKEDSLRTDETLLFTGDAIFGKYVDPIFGQSYASVYTQVRLPSSNPNFGVNPIIDSVVLAMVYDPTYIYGDTTTTLATQTVNVYQLFEDIAQTTNYYSNQAVIKSSFDLAGSQTFVPTINDSVTTTGVKEKPQLRVRLNNIFGTTILNNQNTGNLESNTAFQSFMKGLYITAENSSLAPGAGNIVRLKMIDAKTRLSVYYHNTTEDSLKYEFPLSNSARFSHFKHDYTSVNSLLDNQINNATPPLQNATVFVQANAGLKTKIEFPYLLHWIDSGAVSINKAELVIRVDTSLIFDYNTYQTPANLLLFQINDDSTSNVLVPDYNEGSSYYGGAYNSTTKEYRFNIARYIQQILADKRNSNGIYLITQNGAVTASRLVLGGGDASSAFQMKLNITYTKLH
jgi:hypothetical protein